MSNERKLVKVTIETADGNIKTMEVQGVAFATVTREEDCHSHTVGIVGKMAVNDLMALTDCVENQLLDGLKKEVVKDAFDADKISLSDLIKAMFKKED